KKYKNYRKSSRGLYRGCGKLEHKCQRNIKKTKRLYKNDQNEETRRAKSSMTPASNNTGARDQEMTSEMMDQDQNTTINPNIEILVVEVQLYGYADHNQETTEIEVEDQSSQFGLEPRNDIDNNINM
ncbi:18783_t:CDS:2, partial [Gigaspora margarita]